MDSSDSRVAGNNNGLQSTLGNSEAQVRSQRRSRHQGASETGRLAGRPGIASFIQGSVPFALWLPELEAPGLTQTCPCFWEPGADKGGGAGRAHRVTCDGTGGVCGSVWPEPG